MSNSQIFVFDTAVRLRAQRATMPVHQLADHLNCAGVKTSYGSAYAGGRGTYRLVCTTYHALDRQGRSADAQIVADSFTRPDGTFAYE
jgi:hypothetical protein